MITEKELVLQKFHYQRYMERIGIHYITDYHISFVKIRYPKVYYDAEFDRFTLYFNGPLGYGIQSFYFDWIDFVSAYEDAKGNAKKPRGERLSFCEYFLGPKWFENEKLIMVGMIFFCFNWTPTMLRKAMSRPNSKQRLTPKIKHCKVLPDVLPPQFLNEFMRGDYVLP